MPLQPGPLTEPLVRQILDLYAQAENALLTTIANRLAEGLDRPDWADRQLLAMQRFREEAEVVLGKLQVGIPLTANETARMAVNRGAAVAQAEIGAAGKAIAPAVVSTGSVGGAVDTFALAAAAADLTNTLDATRPQIYRSVNDIYRQVVARASAPAMLGAQTQREAAAQALNEFAARGITGFVDKRGRQWELQSYVDMASRSSLMNASIEGHNAKLASAGFDLVIVSDVPQECERCRPWEGKVLALKPDGQHRSLAEARSAGLYHPGCRHSHTLYVPGRSRSFGETADPQGAKDRERLRYLERQVRASKRQQAAALDDEARKVATARVRAYQAKIREHVDTTSAKRVPWREQIR